MKRLVRTGNDDIIPYTREILLEKISGDIPTEMLRRAVEQTEDYFEEHFFSAGAIPSSRMMAEHLNDLLEGKHPSGVDVVSMVNGYLEENDWRVRENSNMSYSLQGLNNHISSSLISRYWLQNVYPSHIGAAHDRGDIHIHDLGVLGPYCVGWDLQDLLMKGFGGVSGKIESAPARHFSTILGQVVNFFYTLQGEAAGAQAFSNFDTLLAPFVRHDGLTYEEVKQRLQEFLFNMNVPTRVGFQAPFTNITMDLTPSPALAYMPVVIGGEPQDSTYGEYQHEMNMINRAFAELMLEGDAKGRIFTFPIPTYNIHRDFRFDDPELMPLWEMTGKYGIPYFSNFVNSDLSPDDVRSMCCRLRLDTKELKKRGGGLFGANPQTGSIGVVTINMPRIAHLASDETDFLARLNRMMDLAMDSLEIKREVVEELTDAGLYPYTRVYLASVKERFGKWWSNHFSTIGLIGMNEAAVNFLGLPITDSRAHSWVVSVLEHMRERLLMYQEKTGNYYNLEATPAEGASYSLARKDMKLYPSVYAQGDDQVPYYTNSVHPPAQEPLDVFDLLEHQDDLQVQFTGGTVVHLYLGEAITDPAAVRSLVKSIVNRFRLPYFSITPTFSVCPVHGYIPGEHRFCPYPHTEEELRKMGMEVDMGEDELEDLEHGAYREIN